MSSMLIIGTSHSEASCQRVEGGYIEKIEIGKRWFELIQEEYGIDHVMNLSRSNCTTEQQFMVAYNYKKQNPDVTFDYAIVEGRCIESTVSSPIRNIKNLDVHPEDNNLNEFIWDHWTDDFRHRQSTDDDFVKRIYEPISQMDSRVDKSDGEKYYHNDWYVDYAHSYLHAVHLWTANKALISFLEEFCGKVAWYSFSTSSRFHDHNNPLNIMGKDLIGNNALFDKNDEQTFPEIKFPTDYDDHRCKCNHLNESGHKKLFDEILKPRLDESKFFA